MVLGDWMPYSQDLRLAEARASLWLNGVEIDCEPGIGGLGDPAAAVAWLANALAPFGTDLLPGQIVMSGSSTMAAFGASGRYRVGYRPAWARNRRAPVSLSFI